MSSDALSRREVDALFDNVETAMWYTFGALLNRTDHLSLKLKINSGKETVESGYTPRDVGAASLMGVATFELWTPADIEFVTQVSDPYFNRATPVYLPPSENEIPDVDEPTFFYMYNHAYYFDLFTRAFNRQTAIAQCSLTEEGELEFYGETAFSYSDDDEEDLVLKFLEEQLGENTEIITEEDRNRLHHLFTVIGVPIL